LSKVADFDPRHVHLMPPLGVTPVEFRGDLLHQKMRKLEPSAIVCCCLRDPTFSRFSRTPTCYRQTDIHRQTDTGPWLVLRSKNDSQAAKSHLIPQNFPLNLYFVDLQELQKNTDTVASMDQNIGLPILFYNTF